MKRSIFFFIRRLALGVVVAELLASSAVAQTNTAILAVAGAVEQPLALALADLQAMPRTKLETQDKDGSGATYEGVALYELVKRAKPRLSEHCCSNTVNTVVVVKAADNYQAAFSLPELDHRFGHLTILLADRRNGQPLGPRQGPLEIVVPEEKAYGRWVRQVNLVEVFMVGDLRNASSGAQAPASK
jgi:DMSO/TMAO reductase YedYZ molybdopterin-dependent catalytic subunit